MHEVDNTRFREMHSLQGQIASLKSDKKKILNMLKRLADSRPFCTAGKSYGCDTLEGCDGCMLYREYCALLEEVEKQ